MKSPILQTALYYLVPLLLTNTITTLAENLTVATTSPVTTSTVNSLISTTIQQLAQQALNNSAGASDASPSYGSASTASDYMSPGQMAASFGPSAASAASTGVSLMTTPTTPHVTTVSSTTQQQESNGHDHDDNHTIGSPGPDAREQNGISKALDWLKEKRSQDYGWGNDTHMVILAKEVSRLVVTKIVTNNDPCLSIALRSTRLHRSGQSHPSDLRPRRPALREANGNRDHVHAGPSPTVAETH
jgi:hypothetical protein